MASWWLALGFLTTLPVREVAYRPESLGLAAVWFPVVGLLLGVLLATAAWLAGLLFPPWVVAVGVVALWAALTGGLHLDGLADCCDGLLPSVAPERRLEIMADPRVGAFGVLGLVVTLMLKTSALISPGLPAPALLLAPVWARWLILVAARQPAVRPGGLGAAFASQITTASMAWASVLPLSLGALFLLWRIWWTLPAFALSAIVAVAVIALARRRIGGITGDVLGAVVELGEVTVLLMFAVRLP